MLESYFNAFQGDEHLPFHHEGGTIAVLMVHGFPGSPAEMRPLAERLEALGLTTHGLLLPGFGPDFERMAERSQDEWITAVIAALRELQASHDNVILVGNSMGGALAIQAAASMKAPPDGLVLLAPFSKVDHIAWRLLPAIGFLFPQPRLFRYLKLDFTDQEVRQGIHNFMPDADLDDPEIQQAIRDFQVPLKMFAQIHQAGQLARKFAHKVQVPTLVLQGRQDDIVKPKVTRKLISQIGAPVYYREFDGPHNLLEPGLDAWPQIVAEVHQFLNRFNWLSDVDKESLLVRE